MEQVNNINWNKHVALSMPTDWRKKTHLAFLRACFKPVIWLHLQFKKFRDESLYKVNHNSQICYLRAVLNDKFDTNLRRIEINNAKLKQPVWFYEPEENKEVRFYEPEANKPVYFYEETEFEGDGADFIVLVPIDLKPSTIFEETAFLIQMRAQIDYYKLFVKNYIIIWV